MPITIEHAIFASVFLPLFGAFLIGPLARRGGAAIGWVALLFPLASAALLLGVAREAGPQPHVVVSRAWVPSLGVELGFLADGLSLFFALIVSGVGLLIVFYAIFYMAGHYAHLGRFFSYLILFMAAMLGTVLSDHLLSLFIFWELTGICSFLLIGFLHESRVSRIGARQALLVTGGTGLAMLAGILLIGQTAGTFRISELAGRFDARLLADPRATVGLVLLLVGGFGKSAQFPFFFWLPNAMAAPTPVSAYLHSATMVKLGVFLCARLFPIFSGHTDWTPILLTIGFSTMVLGGVLALLQHDLKAMLAFSTVGQLGFLCGYYGLAARTGAEHDYLHILNHTLYKGALFMIAGIVDHAAHQRDIRQLGGLLRRMPLTALVAAVCLASMAGIFGTTGYLSKESALAALRAARDAGLPGASAALASLVAAAVLNVVLALRLFAGVFLGSPRSEGAAHAHAPSLPILLPPLLLAAGVAALGVFPHALDVFLAYGSVPGLQSAHVPELHLWHGWTPEFQITLGAIAGGFALAFAASRARAFEWPVPRALRFGEFFETMLQKLVSFARTATRLVQTENPTAYLPLAIGTVTVLLTGAAAASGLLAEIGSDLARKGAIGGVEPLRVFVASLIALAVIGVLLLRQWTAQLIALSVAGFLTTFFFVIYRAPDLALTQILVEAVSLILILLLLGRFPKSAERGEVTRKPALRRQILNACVAGTMGALMTAFILVATGRPHPDPLGPFYLEQTLPLAQGANAVNTILVDFRGFDTLGEITVLTVAMLGCLGLLMRYKRTPEEFQQGAAGAAGYSEAERKAS